MRLASSREWSPEEIREAFPEPPEEWGRRGKGDIQHALFAGAPDEPHGLWRLQSRRLEFLFRNLIGVGARNGNAKVSARAKLPAKAKLPARVARFVLVDWDEERRKAKTTLEIRKRFENDQAVAAAEKEFEQAQEIEAAFTKDFDGLDSA